MIDIKVVCSSDAFSLVKGPSSAIARNRSIADYGHRPTAFHHIVVRRRARRRKPGGIQALACDCSLEALRGLGRRSKNP
jgi:hypothetical protein